MIFQFSTIFQDFKDDLYLIINNNRKNERLIDSFKKPPVVSLATEVMGITGGFWRCGTGGIFSDNITITNDRYDMHIHQRQIFKNVYNVHYYERIVVSSQGSHLKRSRYATDVIRYRME